MRPSALPVALLAAGAAAQNVTTCADGLYMILARGSNEQGLGRTGPISERIVNKIPGSKLVNLDYPATIDDPKYMISVADGVEELKEVVTDYTTKCPRHKFAVLGYSQGGHIVTDVFCGGTVVGFNQTEALPKKLIQDDLVAFVAFGDPTHVANLTYDHGTSIRNGIFVRKDVKICESYNKGVRSYCDTGDIYCDAGNNRTVHGSYFGIYDNDVVDFVVDRYENSKKGSGSATPTATLISPTPSTTAGSGSSSGSGSGSGSGGASSTSVPGSAAGLRLGLAFVAPLVLMATQLVL